MKWVEQFFFGPGDLLYFSGKFVGSEVQHAKEKIERRFLGDDGALIVDARNCRYWNLQQKNKTAGHFNFPPQMLLHLLEPSSSLFSASIVIRLFSD